MRRDLLLVVLLQSLFLTASPIFAQDDSGGGSYLYGEPGPPLTDAQRKQIWDEIESNQKALRSSGILASKQQESVAAPPVLDWPLSAVPSYIEPGYHGVSNFVDHNAAFPNQLQDYECGTRTYDTASGYNHLGIDYFLWPFLWNLMDAGSVRIVAAAPGTIIFKHDGEFDRSCASNSNMWNAVYVQHADGSIALYGHMKQNSLTSKLVGATVIQGEVLGLVGSSGNSTGPHLHFELHDSLSNFVDPYSGTCNAITSWWGTQRPYYDSAINRIMTGYAVPGFSVCDNESERASDIFLRGAKVYFSAFYRDQRSSQNSTYTIYRPDNSVYATWNHSPPAAHYPASFWFWSYTLPADAATGTWKFEVVYEGVTSSHDFDIIAELPMLDVPGYVAISVLLLVLGVGGTLRGRKLRSNAAVA